MGYGVRGIAALAALLAMAAPAHAASPPDTGWLPNAEDATWTYAWSDSAYSPQPTYERYTVDQRSPTTVTLRWTTDDAGNPPGTAASQGLIQYGYSDAGIVNTTWSSTPPPPQFPILCSSVGQCGNSMAGAHYELIWGTRSPFLQEPLVRGATWSSVGGQGNDVAAVSRYLGRRRVVVPAFPKGVFAAVVESEITQAGAIGDPYGSGSRTTWWVYGVGPVKSIFRHAGGETTSVELSATNLSPRQAPSDRAHLPLVKGKTLRYRYTNSRYMKRASVQEMTVSDVSNNTARVDVKSVRGPIGVVGTYLLTTRTSGVQRVSAATRAATRVHFPQLGPRSQPKSRRRHFFTPLDLMTYGFNPIVPAFPHKGQTWHSSRSSRDYEIYGVTGTTKVVGVQRVRTPAGRYKALLVQSRLTQRGYRFGSGVRKAWYAPGVGLVKLEFRHRDGSVSRVVRVP